MVKSLTKSLSNIFLKDNDHCIFLFTFLVKLLRQFIGNLLYLCKGRTFQPFHCNSNLSAFAPALTPSCCPTA